MPGETNLDALLQTMKPTLNAGEFVFAPLKILKRLRQMTLFSCLQKKRELL
jgi:hypothetical protein